jgi:hypothetical protein
MDQIHAMQVMRMTRAMSMQVHLMNGQMQRLRRSSSRREMVRMKMKVCT